MKRSGPLFTALVVIVALLTGAAGGVLAHAAPMGHHGSHPASSQPVPSDAVPAGMLATVAPCCPAAEVRVDQGAPVPVSAAFVSWHPHPEFDPDGRDIAPETPPPKPGL